MEIIKFEQFVNCMPTEIHRWVIEKKPRTLAEAAKLADEFAILYRPFKLDSNTAGAKFETTEHVSGGMASSGYPKGFKKVEHNVKVHKHFEEAPFCGYCRLRGHVVKDCRSLKRKQNRMFEHKPNSINLVENRAACAKSEGSSLA